MKIESIHTPYVEAVLEQGSISVWRMPAYVSQSRLGGRSAPSNACTVIAVRMAEIIHRTDTKMPTFFKTKTFTKSLRAAAGHEELNDGNRDENLTTHCSRGPSGQATNACPARVISCFTNAIIDGNTLHEEAVRQRVNGEQNFTIPDAIKACKNSVMEVDFCSVPGPLNLELPFYIRAVVKSTQLSRDLRLFFLLIAFERTVLIVFERTTSSLTLFDSHMHGQSDGAVIATGHMDNIGDLCQWLSLNIFHESQSPRDHTRECEISLIRFCGKTFNSDCCLPTTNLPCEFPVFATAKRRRKRRLDTKSTLKVLKYAKTENDCNEGAEVLRASTCPRPQAVIPLASLCNLRSRSLC
ncbi:hypothetical protein V3C99_008025 [Haemonchus contortus]